MPRLLLLMFARYPGGRYSKEEFGNLPKPGDCRSGVGSESRQTDQCLHHLLLNHSAEPAPCEWEAAIRNSPWQSLRPEQYRRTLLLVQEQREKIAAQGRRQPDRGFLVPPYTFTALGSNPSHVCSWAYTKYQPPGSLEYFISRICCWERVIASLPIGMAFFLFFESLMLFSSWPMSLAGTQYNVEQNRQKWACLSCSPWMGETISSLPLSMLL